MKYMNKKTKKVGKVIHYKGITTTLRFDDGKEIIITPANLKKYWVEVPDTDVEKISFTELSRNMYDHNTRYNQDEATLSGVIVYKQDNFSEEYTELQRSYRVWNNNRKFQTGKIANSLYGDCLDGTDDGVRLDLYDWDIEFCYMENNNSTLN